MDGVGGLLGDAPQASRERPFGRRDDRVSTSRRGRASTHALAKDQMNNPNRPSLREVAPNFVVTLETLLNKAGETDLAAQVGDLSIVERHFDRHGCDYYMVPRPEGSWGPGHRTLGLSPGALHVDVLDSKIVCIEVLRGPLNFSPDIEIA